MRRSRQKLPPVAPVGYIDGIPIFLITEAVQNRDFADSLIVSFRCPCGRTHTHGVGKKDDPFRPTHRVAHCADGPLRERGYYIVQKANASNFGASAGPDVSEVGKPSGDATGFEPCGAIGPERGTR